MPEVHFGKKDEPAINLVKSDDLIAIRTRSTESVTSGNVPSAVASELQNSKLIMAFPEAGVEVYRLAPEEIARKQIEDRKATVRTSPDVRFAGSVLVDENTGEPMVYTENIFIKFIDRADPDTCRQVIRDAKLVIKRELPYATNFFFVQAPEYTGVKVFDIASNLLKREDVEYCHPEIVRQRAKRAIFPQQWHLTKTDVGGISINSHANVVAAHEISRGAGITVAIIDDGVDLDHPEFGGANKIVFPRDVTLETNNPRPQLFDDDHGTAVAGVACANGNIGASGVAPLSRLMPIRLSSGIGSEREADAFHWAANKGADVISCSWGPPEALWSDPDDPRRNQPFHLPSHTRLAIEYAVTSGRNGKGCVVFFAAGNGNETVDHDGYSSNPNVIAVAACNDRGVRSVYSDQGDAIWCSFPSNDKGWPEQGHPEPLTPGVWTTDRGGAPGYSPGGFTDSFGGTSSSAPGAAGIAALILAANPNLMWHEVRDIIRRSCDQIDLDGGQYDANGHSKSYGYGRMNALSAVQLATQGNHDTLRMVRTVNHPARAMDTAQVALDVIETQPIRSLAVEVDVPSGRANGLIITLIPPAALGEQKIVLHDRTGADQGFRRRYSPATTHSLRTLQGKSIKGKWTLEVQSADAGIAVKPIQFTLDLVLHEAGQAPPRRPRRPE